MPFKLVRTGKSYSDQRDAPLPRQSNTESGSLPEGYRLKEGNPIPWMLKEWRRVSIPDWRRILNESQLQGDRKREEYARWMLREVLLDPEYEEVNDFSESLLHEASTGKTLHKIVNGVNHINPTSLDNPEPGELPDCPACGRNEWTYTPDGEPLCPCGHKQGGDK